MSQPIVFVFTVALLFGAHLHAIDLSQAAISISPNASEVARNAARMLNDEIAKRTRIRLARHEATPDHPLIVLATSNGAPESFRISIDRSGTQPRVIITGADDRGVLYGVGYLLRKLDLRKQQISL